MAHWPESLKPETWEVVNDSSVDALIESVFGRKWSVQQNEYFSNGETVGYDVYPDPAATALVDEWVASPKVKGYGRVDHPGYGESVEIGTTTILSELCNRGILPEGDMRIYVSW